MGKEKLRINEKEERLPSPLSSSTFVSLLRLKESSTINLEHKFLQYHHYLSHHLQNHLKNS